MTSDAPVATAIRRIAEWSAGLSFDAVPDAVLSVGRNCLIDTIGVALAGASTPVAAIARTVACASAGAGPASVLGSGRKLTAPAAAFVNGTAAHALDFDDNCYAGVVHGSAVIAPASLAAAEMADLSGADLLTAFIAGSEVEYAVGAAAGPSLYDRGWWTTGVLGPIGAAAASARALRLDARQTADAIALAASGVGGAKACFGTDAKALLCGRAAEAGLLAALLARQGASGPWKVLEHPLGVAGLMNGGVFDASAIASLGRTWRLLHPGIDVKRMPVCLSSHAAVDAAMALVSENRIDITHIRRITCDVPPIVRANLAYDRPGTPQEAQFSMSFAVSAYLSFGDLRLDHLRPEVLIDPAVVELMAKVGMVTGRRWDDPGARMATPEGAHVTVELTDGPVLECFRGHARGSAVYPLSTDEMDAKFLACAALTLGHRPAERLLPLLRCIEEQKHVRSFFNPKPRNEIVLRSGDGPVA